MLNAYLKHKLLDFVNSRVIDVCELKSFTCWGHNQGMDRFAEPDDVDWDMAEEFRVKAEEAIDCIENDGLWEWTNIPESFKNDAVSFIKQEAGI